MYKLCIYIYQPKFRHAEFHECAHQVSAAHQEGMQQGCRWSNFKATQPNQWGLGRGKHHQPPSKHAWPRYEETMKKNANRDEWVMSQHHPAASHASRVKTILDSEVLIYILSDFKLIKLIKLNHFLGRCWFQLFIFLHPQDQDDADLLSMCPPWSNLKMTYGNIRARYDQLQILGSQPVVR